LQNIIVLFVIYGCRTQTRRIIALIVASVELEGEITSATVIIVECALIRYFLQLMTVKLANT